MRHALSIDVEDWFHAELVRRRLGSRRREPRVESSTGAILDLLARHDARATFFCVGEVLRDHPALGRRIRDEGHEIGCHGMTHRTLRELGPDGFEAELVTFREVCRDALGGDTAVVGFRAPTFSLDADNGWALPLLARHGFAYDSSVFPMRGPLYGVPGAPLAPYRVALAAPGRVDPASPLAEVPPAVYGFAGVRVPVAGGVYLRLLPLALLRRLLARVARTRPFVLYVHPWEVDPGTPRVPLPPATRVATYHGSDRVLEKLDRLLGAFRFTTVADVVARHAAPRAASNGGPPC